MESMKMWTKNADEGLKHIVHEAGYKAYEFTNTILAYVWWAALYIQLLVISILY